MRWNLTTGAVVGLATGAIAFGLTGRQHALSPAARTPEARRDAEHAA
jgi:hypothetical protein